MKYFLFGDGTKAMSYSNFACVELVGCCFFARRKMWHTFDPSVVSYIVLCTKLTCDGLSGPMLLVVESCPLF